MSSTHLVTITLNHDLVQDYQIFVSSLSTRKKPPAFDELTIVVLQAEERMKSFNLGSSNSYLALVATSK